MLNRIASWVRFRLDFRLYPFLGEHGPGIYPFWVRVLVIGKIRLSGNGAQPFVLRPNSKTSLLFDSTSCDLLI